MKEILILIFSVAALLSLAGFLWKYKFQPMWLMLAAWFAAIAISQLHLSSLELPWPAKYWFLIYVSLLSFIVGAWLSGGLWEKYPFWQKIKFLNRSQISLASLRVVIYLLFAASLAGLYLFYKKAGNFPLLAPDPDQFRFAADVQVPGLINYVAQLARVFIPLSFLLIFWEKFNWRKHLDLILISLVGTGFLIVFASRTQIFFIDLWVMALYLLLRRPNLKQALKFYPAFLLVSVLVLAAVPLYRQYKSYGSNYLASITGINDSHYGKLGKVFEPIYVGVAFNQQALLHAQMYYQTHELQHGKVSLDPFTNIFGKALPVLNKYKSHYDLGAIFYSWWNTGTYLFPFVQDFGTTAFYWVPFVIAAVLALLWQYWKTSPNFLSTNLYAYAIFFITMTVYLSFTVRAEMYLDLMLLFVVYLVVARQSHES